MATGHRREAVAGPAMGKYQMARTSRGSGGRRGAAVRRHGQNTKKWYIAAGIAVPVIVLIVILAQPLLRQYRAQRDVKELVIAMQAYQITFGEYPEDDTTKICAALLGKNAMREPIIEAYQTNDQGLLVDPWDMAYRISTKGGPRAYSCGPNRQDESGTGDDIVSWR